MPLFTKIGRLSIFGSVQFSRAKRFSLLHGEGRRGGGGGGSGGEYGGRPASDAVRRPFRKGGDGYGSAMRFSRAVAAACVYVCGSGGSGGGGGYRTFYIRIYEYGTYILATFGFTMLGCSGGGGDRRNRLLLASNAAAAAVALKHIHRNLPILPDARDVLFFSLARIRPGLLPPPPASRLQDYNLLCAMCYNPGPDRPILPINYERAEASGSLSPERAAGAAARRKRGKIGSRVASIPAGYGEVASGPILSYCRRKTPKNEETGAKIEKNGRGGGNNRVSTSTFTISHAN